MRDDVLYVGGPIQLPHPRLFQCLHQAVENLLEQLGDDVDRVLATLDAAGVPGWPGDPHMDPVCRWLATAVPDLGVQLEDTRLRVWAARADVALVPLPEPVLAAQRAIAAGQAPRLLLNLQPPELPGPDHEDVYPREYLAQLYPPVTVELVDDACTDARCRVCGCTEDAPCEVECVPDGYSWCGWATDQELLAAGVEPMLGDVCSACILVAATTPPALRPARQDDTVTLPVPVGAGDRGGVLVRVAAVCGVGALAAFLLAAGGELQLAGAAVAAAWPGVALALWTPRLLRTTRYPARHRTGGGAHRPEVVAGA